MTSLNTGELVSSTGSIKRQRCHSYSVFGAGFVVPQTTRNFCVIEEGGDLVLKVRQQNEWVVVDTISIEGSIKAVAVRSFVVRAFAFFVVEDRGDVTYFFTRIFFGFAGQPTGFETPEVVHTGAALASDENYAVDMAIQNVGGGGLVAHFVYSSRNPPRSNLRYTRRLAAGSYTSNIGIITTSTDLVRHCSIEMSQNDLPTIMFNLDVGSGFAVFGSQASTPTPTSPSNFSSVAPLPGEFILPDAYQLAMTTDLNGDRTTFFCIKENLQLIALEHLGATNFNDSDNWTERLVRVVGDGGAILAPMSQTSRNLVVSKDSSGTYLNTSIPGDSDNYESVVFQGPVIGSALVSRFQSTKISPRPKEEWFFDILFERDGSVFFRQQQIKFLSPGGQML